MIDLQVQLASSVRSRQSMMPSQRAPSPTHICPQRSPWHGALDGTSEHRQRTLCHSYSMFTNVIVKSKTAMFSDRFSLDLTGIKIANSVGSF